MEQNECECPCECRLDYDSETCLSQDDDEEGDVGEDEDNVAPKAENVSRMCASQIEYIHSYQPMIIKDNVDACNSFSCDMFNEKEDCLGVINCIW